MTTTLTVPARFCGPPRSGNGGWTAGSLAGALADTLGQHAAGAVTVMLRQPPPLDTPLAIERTDDGLSVGHDGSPVATARPAGRAPVPVEPVDAATARAAESSYVGLETHPFPTCVVCGTAREPGDGLRIFPGRLDGSARAAGTWTPHPSEAGDQPGDPADRASLAVTWSALDCTGAWAADMAERLMVLGTMTARIDRLPMIGEEHVVIGEARGREGRKTYSATSVYDSSGRLVGAAEHVWIEVDPEAFT